MPRNIGAMLNSIRDFANGCFYVRTHVPFLELKKRGFDTSYITKANYNYQEVVDNLDAVVFSRVYQSDPLRDMWRFQKAGIPCIYELDDYIWEIPEVNPAHETFKPNAIAQVEELARNANAVTVSTEPLKEKLSEFNDNVYVCPNAVSFSQFKKRVGHTPKPRIGWVGGANHYGDLELIVDELLKLDKEIDFEFVIQGLSSAPIESEMYYKELENKWEAENHSEYRNTSLRVYEKLKQLKSFTHYPFYPPEFYPNILSQLNLDIGLIPITKDKFNHYKSCIKFYEYAAVGTLALASDELPYKDEVNFTVEDNNWAESIKWALANRNEAKELQDKQYKYVKKKRDIAVVAKTWEKAYSEIIDRGCKIS